jgi:phosphohistidine phosphatase
MRTLYVQRHAKSSWKDEEVPDHDRPPAPRGRREARAIAEHRRRERIAPALILCSSGRRARQIRRLVAPALRRDPQIVVGGELYGPDATGLLRRLHHVPARVCSVMLVGHNPAAPDLTVMLSAPGGLRKAVRSRLATGALVTLAIPQRELAASRQARRRAPRPGHTGAALACRATAPGDAAHGAPARTIELWKSWNVCRSDADEYM